MDTQELLLDMFSWNLFHTKVQHNFSFGDPHCFKPGLERNAVEHAGDIAEALQEKLSVCLRLDRPWEWGDVKAHLLGPFGPWILSVLMLMEEILHELIW